MVVSEPVSEGDVGVSDRYPTEKHCLPVRIRVSVLFFLKEAIGKRKEYGPDFPIGVSRRDTDSTDTGIRAGPA